jgi:Tol biopolymer transport system component
VSKRGGWRGSCNGTREGGWSPDGSKIAVDVAGSDFGELTNVLMVVDVARGEQTVLDSLVHPEVGIESFSWSPDSRMLAYVLWLDIQQEGTSLAMDDIKDSEVFLINADGTGRSQLTETPEIEAYVKWCQDGRRLLVSDTDHTLKTIELARRK